MENKFMVRQYQDITEIMPKINDWLEINQCRFDVIHGFYHRAYKNWENFPIQLMITVEDLVGNIQFVSFQSLYLYGWNIGCTLLEKEEKELLYNTLYHYLKEHQLDKQIKKIVGEIDDAEIVINLFNEDRKDDPFLISFKQLKHNLTQVNKEYLDNKPPGKFRLATETDFSILKVMRTLFDTELFGSNFVDDDNITKLVNMQIKNKELFLWEIMDDKGALIPTAMVGITRQSNKGASIAPVYTYLEHRRKGYATAATAELAAYCLNVLHKEYVTLFTDLDNPTSNSIYQKIGFVPDVKWKIYSIKELMTIK